MVLSSPVNATISSTDNTSTITISDDDQAPTISLAQSTYTQAENGGQVVFVSLSGPSNLGTSVAYQTNDGTAVAGQDYTAASGTINIPPGNSTDNITISLTDDTDIEIGKTFSIVLSNPDNATLNYNNFPGLPLPTMNQTQLSL